LYQRFAYKINLNTKEIDFQDILAGSYNSFVSHLLSDVKEAYTRLANHLDMAIACSSSSKNINAGTVSNERTAFPWWMDKCKEAIIKRRQTIRIWQKIPTTKNFYNFKKARAKGSLQRKEKKMEKICWIF